MDPGVTACSNDGWHGDRISDRSNGCREHTLDSHWPRTQYFARGPRRGDRVWVEEGRRRLINFIEALFGFAAVTILGGAALYAFKRREKVRLLLALGSGAFVLAVILEVYVRLVP